MRQLIERVLRPPSRLRSNAIDRGVKGCSVAAFGGDAAQFEKCRKVARLGGENLQNQLLKFIFAALRTLPFHLEGKLVCGLKIRGIELHSFAQIRNCAGWVASVAAENPHKVVDVIVIGCELVRSIESFRGEIEGALPQRENSPVGPGGGLTGSELCSTTKGSFGAHIVAHLQCRQANIERRDEFVILRRRRRGKSAMAPGCHDQCGRANSGCEPWRAVRKT